jgi:hypothetical protein
LSNRTEANFQAWRHQRDWSGWKYAKWDAGFKLPMQLPSGRSKCFCGADLVEIYPSRRGAVRLMAAKVWKQWFGDPIPLPRGRQLVMLKDART